VPFSAVTRRYRRRVPEPESASQVRPLTASAGALLVALVAVEVLRPPDPYPFVIFLLAMPVVVGGLVVSHRRQAAQLQEEGVTEKARSLPWAWRLSGVAPLALAYLADKAGAEQPVPAVLLVGGFVVVALLLRRRMSHE
jgi:cobalamin synthase